jgi:hypothetical protein
MASPSSEAVTPGGNAVAAQNEPPPAGDAGPAALALPQRVAGTPLPATPARTTQPPPDPEILRRVLDGLKRL